MSVGLRKYTNEEIVSLRPTILAEIKRQFPYPTPRHNQPLVIYQMIKAFLEGKKYFVLEASTGFGKSVAAVVALKVIQTLFKTTDTEGQIKNFKTCICTKTKALQRQYAGDYPQLASLWSASGYACNREPYNPEAYYGSHKCDKKLCKYFKECNFLEAKAAFKANDNGILNYAYLLHWQDYNPDLIALDEAHNLEKVLVDHLHVKFNPASTTKILENLEEFQISTAFYTRTITEEIVKIVEIKDTDANWLAKIRAISSSLIDMITPMIDSYESIKQQIDDGLFEIEEDDKKTLLFNGNALTAMYSKLFRLLKSSVEWVISERDNVSSIDLKPISLAEEASAMFSRAQFCILMSATICGIPLFCKMLGIKEGEYASISLDSEVPVENRRIVPVNLQGMSMANREALLPLYVDVLDKLISSYAGTGRGLIHSVTYDNASYIIEKSKHRKRMIIPETEDMLEIKKLLDKHPNALLVTPAMTEGSDLSGDYCRFIAFFKIPFPYLGDKWVSRKKDIDNEWYIREAINQVVQGCGRGVRSIDDHCLTVILDGNFDRIRYKKDLMPAWFSAAILGS